MANETELNLTKNQLKALPVILGAKTITAGVQKAGISKTTFYEWIKTPEFKAEFVRQRKDLIDLALHELKAATSEAVAVLRGLLNSKQENIRLRTALGMLDHISKFIQLEELEQRIIELEKAAKK
jgi:hypothetical protein